MVQKVPAEFKPECALSKDSITTYDTDHPENHPGFDQCVLEETHLSPLDPGTMQMIDDIDPTSLGDADGDGYLEVSAEVMAEVQELDGSGKTYQLAPFFSDAEEKEPVLMEKIKAVGEVALDVAQWFLPITFGKLSDEKRLDGLPEGLKDATRFHHFEAARDYFSSPKEENFQSCEYNNIDKDKCLLRSKQKNQIFFLTFT